MPLEFTFSCTGPVRELSAACAQPTRGHCSSAAERRRDVHIVRPAENQVRASMGLAAAGSVLPRCVQVRCLCQLSPLCLILLVPPPAVPTGLVPRCTQGWEMRDSPRHHIFITPVLHTQAVPTSGQLLPSSSLASRGAGSCLQTSKEGCPWGSVGEMCKQAALLHQCTPRGSPHLLLLFGAACRQQGPTL